MKKGLIAVSALIIIAIAAWFVFANKNTNNNSSSTNNSAQNQTSSGNAQNNTQAATDGQVTIANMIFSPSQVTISKGGSVTWTNHDSVAHTVTSDTGSELNSGDISPGATYSHKFNETGSYQYHCSIHPSMRGTIVVK